MLIVIDRSFLPCLSFFSFYHVERVRCIGINFATCKAAVSSAGSAVPDASHLSTANWRCKSTKLPVSNHQLTHSGTFFFLSFHIESLFITRIEQWIRLNLYTVLHFVGEVIMISHNVSRCWLSINRCLMLIDD